jgi:hypothetical protein
MVDGGTGVPAVGTEAVAAPGVDVWDAAGGERAVGADTTPGAEVVGASEDVAAAGATEGVTTEGEGLAAVA